MPSLPVDTSMFDQMGNATGVSTIDDRPPSERSGIGKAIDRLLGLGGEERYQLWPERVLREGISAPHDVMSSKVPLTSEDLIAPAMSMSALAGSGGFAGVGEEAGLATLGSTPFLHPALKYNGKIHKGPIGGELYDAIPKELHQTFQQQAMSGEDLSNFNFGFMNHKGQFLSREDALKYAIDQGLIHPNSEAARSGTLTSTMQLMADSSKPGTAIEALKPAGPFYSAAEKAIEAVPQVKMTGEQWLGTLANKPGVKPEELDWTGLRDFLAEKGKEPVTKEQVQAHLNDNKVSLGEVDKDTGELYKAAKEFNAEAGPKPINLPGRKGQLYADEIEQGLWDGSLTPKDLPTNLQPYAEKMLSLRYQQEQPTKYYSYQLPGGENYREKLLTLPGKAIPKEDFAKQSYETWGTNIGKWENLNSADKQQWYDFADRNNHFNNGETYKSSHWDEPNILAHVRMNDRTIEGKKSLHLEEIQSDWHQQGRDKGYIGDPDPSRYGGKLTADNSAIPNAPFKKTWHELALKRMLHEAATKGYDRLSWTPGEAQAARYDLSKQVDYLSYDPMTKTLSGVKSFSQNKPGYGNEVLKEHGVKPEEIEKYVGKEAAKKLLETKPKQENSFSREVHSLKGEDLKIGGEGMKGFYDQIIPKAIEKLGKEHGVKVKQGETVSDERGWHITPPDQTVSGKWMVKSNDYNSKGMLFETEKGAKDALENVLKKKTVSYIDIPQSLKDQAMKKGFPLFSTGLPIPNESNQ